MELEALSPIMDYGAVGMMAFALFGAMLKLHVMHSKEREQWFQAYAQLQKETNNVVRELSIAIHEVLSRDRA